MIVRVLRKAERNGWAIVTTSLASLGFAALVFDDMFYQATLLPLPSAYGGVALLVGIHAAAAFGPLLRTPGVGRNVRVQVEDDGIRLGRTRIGAQDVVAVSSADGAVGTSVALRTRTSRMYLEVQDRDAAARLVAALGGPRPDAKGVATATTLPSVQLTVRVLLVLFGVLHIIEDPFVLSIAYKAIVGLAAGLLGVVATVLVLVRALVARSGVRFRDTPQGAWTRHEALHAEASSGPAVEPSASDAPTAAWLVALDARASATRGIAYRDGSPSLDALQARLRDAEAEPRERLAAARMLRVAFEVAPHELEGAVASEPELRARIPAICVEDPELAAERLDALGPAFRAR